MSTSTFTWKPFYSELATKLLPFQKNREELVKILNGVYETINQKNPLKSNAKEKGVSDIDPFTVLGLINRGITAENRIIALTEFKKVFKMESEVPSDFDGVPQFNNMRAWLFTYDAGNKVSDSNEINILWNAFIKAYEYTKGKTTKKLLIKALNKAFSLYLVKWNLTLGLFWYFSDNFISLDGRTREYLIKKGLYTEEQIENILVDSGQYLTICEEAINKVKGFNPFIENFRDLSASAYVEAEAAKEETKEEAKLQAYYFISADPGIFSFEKMAIGDSVSFTYKNEKGNYRQIRRNFISAKKGDVVVCYDSRPTQKVIALAEITNNDPDNEITLIKTKHLDNPIEYEKLKGLPFVGESEYFKANRGTLFKLTKREYEEILSLTNESGVASVLMSSLKACNKLYYGIPGCGKSYEVDKYVKNNFGITDGNDNKIRTTFYLDYSYNDFVGQLMPQSVGGVVEYKIKAGPFTKALERAYRGYDMNTPVVLIIEEINRGNAPAIFGDIFQLLDRDDNGESEYEISNVVIEQYLKENGVINPFKNTIKIPKNLWIFATMNSSDQNVFKLDTAFKRRWDMKRMTNTDAKAEAETNNSFLVPGTNTSWIEFVDRVNEILLKNDLNEDRQLGYWFVLNKNIEPLKTDEERKEYFSNKVLEYLWNDVLKFHDKVLFKSDITSFDDLINKYMKDSESVFAEGLLDVQKDSDSSQS